MIRSLAFTAMSGLVAFSAAPAADPAARSAPNVSDVVLARSALAALDADSALKECNVLVSVVDRVALVGGPVLSAEHAKRAEAVIRRVPGIVDVKNRCYVQDVPDPLLRALAGAPTTKPANLPGVVASPRTGQVEELTPPLVEPALAKVEPAGKPVVALRPMNPSDSVLFPPVGPSSKPAPAAPPAVLTSGRAGEALAAAEALRKADARFAKLTVTFANGLFVIGGQAARASDAWDLAQELRRIPGAPRVALGAIDVK